MDQTRFDALTRSLSGQPTRRVALRLLAGSLLGGLLARGGIATARAAQIDDVGALTDPGPSYTCASQGLTDCGGYCADLSSDPLNCGACGSVCAEGTACIGGWCQTLAVNETGVTDIVVPGPCAVGLTDCGGSCVDLGSDNGHCGACFTPCPLGGFCQGGLCNVSAMVEDSGLRTNCTSLGLTDCDVGYCVDLSSDPEFCGSCSFSSICLPPDTCQNGQCLCQSGFTRCEPQSFYPCSDLASDPFHCGACSNRCLQGEICQGGVCT